MRVLLINVVCGIRSTGRICTDIADLLTDEGHECKIAYGRETVPEQYKKYAVRIGTELDAKIHALGSRIFDNTGFYSTRATKKFIKWVKEYDPDVINLHNIHGYYLNIKLLFDYLRESGKPVVWTLHDCWAFTGHCCYYTAAKCNKWLTGCYKCQQKESYPTSLFIDNCKKNHELKKKIFTSLNNCTIVTVSKWLGVEAEKSFLGCYTVKVVQNGIDLSVFKPIQSDFKLNNRLKGKKIILSVATSWADKRKGLEDVIKLSTKLDDSYVVVALGVTEEEKKALPSTVMGITRTNNVKELAEIYTSADVYFCPSIEETFGLPTVEAMACGTPAVVYNSTALPEIVTDKSGYVVETHNIDAVVEKIKQCEELLKDDIINNAQKYSKESMLNNYLHIYSDVLENTKQA